MKRNIFLLSALLLTAFMVANTVFDFKITLTNGKKQPLVKYKGKRMVIVVLPSLRNAADSAMLVNLDSIQRSYKDSITFVGIPSYEDGYEDDSLKSLSQWYKSVLDSSFIIGQGMNTRKASPYQSPLFSWLTHAEQNGHFDQDVMGAGEKFLITKDGILKGLVDPDVPLDEEMMEEDN